jgi:arginine/lysine/ornithine decarboxylase
MCVVHLLVWVINCAQCAVRTSEFRSHIYKSWRVVNISLAKYIFMLHKSAEGESTQLIDRNCMAQNAAQTLIVDCLLKKLYLLYGIESLRVYAVLYWNSLSSTATKSNQVYSLSKFCFVFLSNTTYFMYNHERVTPKYYLDGKHHHFQSTPSEVQCSTRVSPSVSFETPHIFLPNLHRIAGFPNKYIHWYSSVSSTECR